MATQGYRRVTKGKPSNINIRRIARLYSNLASLPFFAFTARLGELPRNAANFCACRWLRGGIKAGRIAGVPENLPHFLQNYGVPIHRIAAEGGCTSRCGHDMHDACHAVDRLDPPVPAVERDQLPLAREHGTLDFAQVLALVADREYAPGLECHVKVRPA